MNVKSMMENFPFMISTGKQVHHFEVGEYLHHDGESCKFRVFENGAFVASFEPDSLNCLHICQNPGAIDEEVLHLLADKIEAHHPMAPRPTLFKGDGLKTQKL